MSDIDRQVKDLHKKLDMSAKLITTEFVDQVFNKVRPEFNGAFGSPVDTGRYYNSHRIAINGQDTSEYGVYPESTLPPMPQNYARSKMAAWKLGDTVHMTNVAGAQSNNPYARIIETLGWATRGPYGTYKIAAGLVASEFATVLKTKLSVQIRKIFAPQTTAAKVG